MYLQKQFGYRPALKTTVPAVQICYTKDAESNSFHTSMQTYC